MTDQNGTVHSYSFDLLGRETADVATTVGTGVDTAVLRLETAYEVRGMKTVLTSFDNATVGAGSIVNQCQFAYNNFKQLIRDYQSHIGAVNLASTPSVQYGFADGSLNRIRPIKITCPNGREINFTYGSSGSIPDSLSRVDSIQDSSAKLAAYSYLGKSAFVVTDYTEPQIKWTMADLTGAIDPDTGDAYSGFDRFSRVKDNRWYNYASGADVDRIKYGYDRSANRTWRQNTVALASGAHLDELYINDRIDRLKSATRGQLTAGNTAITNETFAQFWALDSTGNWQNFLEDNNGDGTWDLSQTRTSNTVNEITGISTSVGTPWVTPAYDKAGNTTTMPQPASPSASYTATYDAWNRLVKLAAGANTVSTYAYDAARRRYNACVRQGGWPPSVPYIIDGEIVHLPCE